MANLGWNPIKVDPVGPPWGWNPGQTFVTAFNEAKQTRLLEDKMQREAEMEQILFPLKQQKMALELDKLQAEVERQTEFTKRLRAGYSQVNPVVKGAITDPAGGGGSNEGGFNYFQAIKRNQTATDSPGVLVDFDQISGQ